MDIRSIDTGAGLEQVVITATVSLKGADAGTIPVFATLPYPMKITEIRIILTGLLVTASSSALIKVSDGTHDILANQTVNLADTIGTVYTGTVDATYCVLNGSDQLQIVTTAGGTASTGGTALVVIKAKKIGENS